MTEDRNRRKADRTMRVMDHLHEKLTPEVSMSALRNIQTLATAFANIEINLLSWTREERLATLKMYEEAFRGFLALSVELKEEI